MRMGREIYLNAPVSPENGWIEPGSPGTVRVSKTLKVAGLLHRHPKALAGETSAGLANKYVSISH